MQCSPPPWCILRLPSFTLQQLGNLLWGLGRVNTPAPSGWLAAAVNAGAGKLPTAFDAQGADLGRLLGGLARLRPHLPPSAYAADSDDAGSSDTGGGDVASSSEAASPAGASRPSGRQLWASNHSDAVTQLLAGAAPLLARSGPRELCIVAQAAVALGVLPAPAGFTAALADALAVLEADEQVQGDRAAADIAAAHAALQQLE
jgi:hypothetical protein